MSPVQRVLDEDPVLDMVPPPAVPPRLIAESACADWWDSPFDLEKSPPVRARLMRLAADRHLFLTGIHHISFDEWSWRIFQRDLGIAYSERVCGRVPSWEPVPTYQSFVRRERDRLAEWRDADIPFWRDLLSDPPRPMLRLPGPTPEAVMADHTVELEPASVRALTERGKRLGRLPLPLLLTGTAQVLGEMFGVSRMNVGTLFSGRLDTEFRSVIGCFVNPLVIPLEYSASLSFDDRLREVTRSVLRCLRHARTPFNELVRELGAVGRRDPWYQVTVVLYAGPVGGDFETGIEVDRAVVRPPRTSSDLVIEVLPLIDKTWRIGARWRTDSIEDRVGRALVEELTRLLRGLAEKH